MEQIKEKNLQTANTIQSISETPKITNIFLSILSCCSYEKLIPKCFFLSLLKVPGKSLELLKPVRFGKEWNRKSALYIRSCCRDAKAEENPFKGKPGTEPEKKFNWHPAKSSINPFHDTHTETALSIIENLNPSTAKIKTFSHFSFQKDILLDR